MLECIKKSRLFTEELLKKNLKRYDAKYYVYVVVNPSKQVVYIGKGSGSRYKHVTSGTSSSYELNKDHFLGVSNKVYLHSVFKANIDALVVENELIDKFQPIYNKTVIVSEKSIRSRLPQVITKAPEGIEFFNMKEKLFRSYSNQLSVPRLYKPTLNLILSNLKRGVTLILPKSKLSNISVRKVDTVCINPRKIWHVINLLELNGDVIVGEYSGFPTITPAERT